MNQAHEELLRRIVIGELGADAAEVRAAAAADAEFARELAATLKVVRALRHGDELREAVLAEIDAGRHEAALAQPVRRRRALLWVPMLAAGLIAAAVVWTTWPKHTETPDDIPLGSTWLVVDSPKGEVADYSEFTWRSSALDGRFEIVVKDEHGQDCAGGHQSIVGQRSWKPDVAVHSKWPGKIHWTLEWFDDSDRLVKASFADASRRH